MERMEVPLERPKLVQPQKAWWDKHEYKRRSVERDVDTFCGWETLTEIVQVVNREILQDLIVCSFKVAGRITETLNLRREMFEFHPENNQVIIRKFRVLKRYKKVDSYIECGRCGEYNNKFDVECKDCGANLIHGGKRHYITEPIVFYRKPFTFPYDEKLNEFLFRRVEQTDDFLFVNPDTDKPYSRQWAYEQMKPFGYQVGLGHHLYTHWFRAERLSQLGEEYSMDELELKNFTAITKSETISKYAKKYKSYAEKMGIKNPI